MIEKKLREKIVQLIERSDQCAAASFKTNQGLAQGRAWIAETLNVIKLALPDPSQTYRSQIEKNRGTVQDRVLTIGAILRSMLADLDAGLVSTLANAIRAETFENFLDHAVEYRMSNRKDEAGVIAGVVFEDTLRKIYADKIDKIARPDLEQVIIALVKDGAITDEQAKQARVAAYVRTKATHADWTNFTMEGVDDTIKITKILLKQLQ